MDNRSNIQTFVQLQDEWGKYKYWTMARSQKSYNDLRIMFKNEVSKDDFYSIIDSLKNLKREVNSESNAFLHVFGYFKKICTESEKKHFLNLYDNFRIGLCDSESVYNYLHMLAVKYDITYLLNSYYFNI